MLPFLTSLKLLLHSQTLNVVCGFVGVVQFTVQGHNTALAAL